MPTEIAEAPTTDKEVLSPDLLAHFDEVFGGQPTDSSGDIIDTGEPAVSKKEPQTNRTRQRRRQQKEEEAASLEGMAGLELEDDPNLVLDKGEEEGNTSGDPETAGQIGGEDDNTSTLSPLLRHAAQRSDLTNEQIDEFYKKDPELAVRHFTILHNGLNEIASRFTAVPQPGSPPPPQEPNYFAQGQSQQPPAQPPMDPALAAFLNRQVSDGDGGQVSLTEKYGQGMIDDVIGPLGQMLVQPMAELRQMRQEQTNAHTQQVVETWNRNLDKPFKDLYGEPSKRNEAQSAQWTEMVKLASGMYSNDQRLGGQMKLTDAMDYALHSHAAPLMATIERKKITDQVKNRSSRTTVRPTQRRGSLGGGEAKPKTTEAAVDAYADQAREFGLIE